jgi:hypothetical protein
MIPRLHSMVAGDGSIQVRVHSLYEPNTFQTEEPDDGNKASSRI